ncbi:MAG: N-formylglutamate amidohydrolase [Rhodospirillales bacterium]
MPPDNHGRPPKSGEAATAPYAILAPDRQTLPLVFASPHSGRDYTDEFLAQSRLDISELRRSEDAFVDELFAAAPELGAPMLKALFPRAYIDPNRQPWELDREMFSDYLPVLFFDIIESSPHLAVGLGCIPRIITSGERIYRGQIRFEEAKRRMETYYIPYHHALKGLLEKTQEQFGGCLLIDCHSMPSIGGPMDKDSGDKRVDMVLGDCHGAACLPGITAAAETALAEMGFVVTRNSPYSGGYTTRHYGKIANRVHALQIEINRALYMDELAFQRGPGLPALKQRIGGLIEALAAAARRVLAA